jgi:hypothetical protein
MMVGIGLGLPGKLYTTFSETDIVLHKGLAIDVVILTLVRNGLILLFYHFCAVFFPRKGLLQLQLLLLYYNTLIHILIELYWL